MTVKDPLIENIESVFSILPDNLAREARVNTMTRMTNPSDVDAHEVKWAEFDSVGTFLRGGGTDLSGLTRLVTSTDRDPVLGALVATAVGGVTVGTIISLADHDLLFWFIPIAPRHGGQWSQASVKGLAVSLAVFAQLGQLLDAKVNLTPAEKRVLFQTTAGMSLRAAAAADNVSVETRRTQIKSLCAKLNCTSKHELTRFAIGQMMRLVALCEAETPELTHVEQFTARYLSADARLILQRLPNGRLVRCLEIGPLSGTPVLVMHGMLFPALIIDAHSHLAAAGIKLILPLRHGYLDARPLGGLLQDDDLIGQSLADIADFVKLTFSEPVTVLGHSYGAPIALHFASKYPDIVARTILLSINAGTLHHEKHLFSHRFYSSLQRLLDRPGLFRLISWQFRKAYADILTVRPILRKLYGGCDDDLAALEGASGAQSFYPWFAECYQTSIGGIAADFRFILQDWRSDIVASSMPTTIIHGREDPMIRADQVAALATEIGADSVKWIKGGHLICATQPGQVWSAVTTSMALGLNDTKQPAAR